MYNTIDDLKEDFDLEVIGNIIFLISFNKDKWDAELYGRGASGADKSKYVDSKYLTLDFSLQYKVQKDYKIYAKAYNLTNASYAETGGVSNGKYSFPMPGRSFLIGMEYAF